METSSGWFQPLQKIILSRSLLVYSLSPCFLAAVLRKASTHNSMKKILVKSHLKKTPEENITIRQGSGTAYADNEVLVVFEPGARKSLRRSIMPLLWDISKQQAIPNGAWISK